MRVTLFSGMENLIMATECICQHLIYKIIQDGCHIQYGVQKVVISGCASNADQVVFYCVYIHSHMRHMSRCSCVLNILYKKIEVYTSAWLNFNMASNR